MLLRPLFQYLTQQFLCLLSAFLMMVHRVYICLNCSFSLQNVSALDLASLSDNAPVATYLARLLESLGFDPNEPNKQGHTVLHLLARKGDDFWVVIRRPDCRLNLTGLFHHGRRLLLCCMGKLGLSRQVRLVVVL